MDNQYEDEINLVTLMFKVCQRWRALLAVAAVAAVAIGGTRLAMNIQSISDGENIAKLEAEYEDTLKQYEAEGENLERRMNDNQRKLGVQTDYNDKSMLMKVDPHNEWVGSMNLYIDTHYQIMPESSIQNENPAYKITYAYYDYYAGSFYPDVLERLSFDLGEIKYLREALGVSINVNRYSIQISAVADTEGHCGELIKAAGEAFRSRYGFVASSLGEHSLTLSDPVVYSQVNENREQYQIEQKNRETDLQQNVYTLNQEYREWEKREKDIEKPVLDLASAVKNGVKWILIAAVAGGFLGVVILFIIYMLSGRIKSAEDLGRDACILAELPVRGKKKNAIDRLICRLFGVAARESEYDSRLEAMVVSLQRMLGAGQCGKGTIAFVGDVAEDELKAFVKQVGEKLPAGYEAVAAGNIIAEPTAARVAYEADVVVLVAKQDVTMKKIHAQVCSKLSACKVEVLGAVLFGVECI